MQLKFRAIFAVVALAAAVNGRPSSMEARQDTYSVDSSCNCIAGDATVLNVPATFNTCATTGSGECITTGSVFAAELPSLPMLGSAATLSMSIGVSLLPLMFCKNFC